MHDISSVGHGSLDILNISDLDLGKNALKGRKREGLPFWNPRAIIIFVGLLTHRTTDLNIFNHSFLSKILISICINRWVIINLHYLLLNLVQ